MTWKIWPAAMRIDQARMIERSGGRIGVAVLRSGTVPTSTFTPASWSRMTAWARWLTATRGRTRRITSLEPTRMTAMSASAAIAFSTCGCRSEDFAPISERSCRRTGRWAFSETPEARTAPGVSSTSVIP